MTEPSRVVAILGVTGRLGPAVAQAFAGWEVRGLSRREPHVDEVVAGARVVLGQRDSPSALADLVDGADVVVDLLCFSVADAETLLEALRVMARPPTHLIYASSIAARLDADDYGRGKRLAGDHYAKSFEGHLHTLILPRLVAAVDHHRREQPYLDSAATGRALHRGSGQQRQTIASVGGVAEMIRMLADDPDRVPSGAFAVGPPEPIRVRAAIEALLEGANLRTPTARHPDPNWRAPHGGGDEILDVTPIEQWLPELRWPDPRQTYRELGAWLMAHPTTARPRPVVRKPQKQFTGRRMVDVHGRRRSPVLAYPHPELETIARWLSPSFYVDTGRPCNSACVYCAVPPHGDTEGFVPLERLRETIATGRAAGCERAILIGGEPTIYPHLQPLLEVLAEAGLKDNIVMTNGLRLAEPGFASTLVEGGVSTFHLSIDTADPVVYDRLSRSTGQSSKQWRALDHVLALPASQVYVYTAVTRPNAEGIPQLLETIARHASQAGRPPPVSILAFVKPIGDALTHADELLIAPAERAVIALRALSVAEATGTVVGFRNLQACLAPSVSRHLVDYYLEDYSVDIVSGEPETNAHASYWSHEAPCEACAHRAVCTGAYVDDIRRFGAEAFRAIGHESLNVDVVPAHLRPPA